MSPGHKVVAQGKGQTRCYLIGEKHTRAFVAHSPAQGTSFLVPYLRATLNMTAHVVIVAARYVPEAEYQRVGTNRRRPGKLFIAWALLSSLGTCPAVIGWGP